LNVQYDDVSEAVLGGGLRVAYVIKYEDGVKIIPSLYGQIYHDFLNEKQQSIATFSAGGTSFFTPSFRPDETSARVGGKIDFIHYNGFELTFNYDYHFKTDFHAHSGNFKIRYEWA